MSRSFAATIRKPLVVLSLPLLLAVAVAEAAAQAVNLTRYRLVDLTHTFGARTLYWPTATTGFKLDQLTFGETPGGYFYSSYAYSAPEHGGTHLDAPLHFAAGGHSTADVPLERLIAPAVVIDISTQAARDRNYRLSVDDVEAFERAHGRVGPGTIVLVRTGWSRFWSDRKAYLGDKRRGAEARLSFPGIGEDAARLLVEDRQAGVLGIDTASIDYGPSTDFLAHRVGAARNVPNLENLTNLDRLPPTGAVVIVSSDEE